LFRIAAVAGPPSPPKFHDHGADPAIVAMQSVAADADGDAKAVAVAVSELDDVKGSDEVSE
jgi:hypothetical protein